MFRMWSKMHRLKPMFFANRHCSLIIYVIFELYLLRTYLLTYLNRTYLLALLVIGWSAENIEEKKKRDRIKTLTSEEKEKRRIRGKSNNSNIHLWF